MRKAATLPILFFLLVNLGCGEAPTKEEYDAKHGKGAWDHMEEQESRNIEDQYGVN